MLISAFTLLTREIDIFLGFSWRDWSATLIPGSLFSMGAMLALPHTIDIFHRYLYLILWLTAFIYFFDLSNQITGMEEDRINKPDRPLPSGKVTIAGAKKRWLFSLLAFLSITLYHPTLLTETITWIITVYILEATPFGDHWLVKSSLAMGAGTWALLRGSWKAIAPLTPLAERYVLAMSLWTVLLTHIQDLRDIKGDAATGRQTLPIAVGDSHSRWIITLGLMPISLVGLWIGDILALAPVPLVGAHVFLGYRILQKRGALYDHKTYMIYTYIFCFILALTALDGIKWGTNLSLVFDHIKRSSVLEAI